VRTTNIDESLGQHIESTQNWQQYTGERIRNLKQQQQQSQEWRAYYRWAGFQDAVGQALGMPAPSPPRTHKLITQLLPSPYPAHFEFPVPIG